MPFSPQEVVDAAEFLGIAMEDVQIGELPDELSDELPQELPQELPGEFPDELSEVFTKGNHLEDAKQDLTLSNSYEISAPFPEVKIKAPISQSNQFTKIDEKFKCKLCDYMTHKINAIRGHIRYHNKIYIQCFLCDTKMDKSNLKEHVRFKHSGLRYDCNQCDYQTSYPQNLKKHSSRAHNDVVFSCNECDYKCKNDSTLRSHVNTKHVKLEQIDNIE